MSKQTNTPATTEKVKKMSQARTVFQANATLPRKDVIALFQANCGLSAAGAATYYQTLKKEAAQA